MQHQLTYVLLLVAISLIISCKRTTGEDPLSSTTTTTASTTINRTITHDGSTVDLQVDTKDFETFLMACSQGDIDTVREYVQNNDTKHYVTAYSKNGGESCLHVAGILGQATVTQYILQNGGNPNQRSQNIPHGLRMTPLSWNVYGNHIENVQLLLTAGANANLDFDYIIDGTQQKVTVLDLLLYIHGIDFRNDHESTADEKEAVRAMHDLLLQHGAQRYSDLQQVHPIIEHDASAGNHKSEL
jgi:hypothetical protein